MVCSRKSGPDCSVNSTESANSIRKRHSPTEHYRRQKRGDEVGKTKRGKGTKTMVLVEGHGIPMGVDTASASPHEVTLIEALLEKCVVRQHIERLIYDRSANSDDLRRRLRNREIELICPHKKNRRRTKTKDGCKLRRYCRRWKVERSINRLQNFR